MDYQLDLTAYRCPLPLLMTKKALLGLAKGDILHLSLSDDANVDDIRLLCIELGYSFQQNPPCEQQSKRSIFTIFLQ